MPNNEQNPPTEQGSISYTNQPGAKIVSVYVERKVKVFAIHEPELTTVSYLNSAATACFSVGAFFLSTVLTPNTTGFWANPLTWATGLFFLGGIIATFFKCGIIQDIKKQSQSGEEAGK